MNERTEGVMNLVLTRDYVCAQCFGLLVEKFVDGKMTVACPRHCEPGGFVTLSHAARFLSASVSDFEEVARNYPQFDHRKKLSPAELAADMALLY